MGRSIESKKDEEVAFLVQSGQLELFGILVEKYEEKIKRYAKKFLSNKEDINDVVQDIFIKTYENIQSFDSKRKFSPWLYRIAHNELVNTLKKKKEIIPFSLFDLDIFLPQEYKNNEIENKIERERIKGIINECVEELDFKYREPIVLYYFEELSYKEIADVMQIPVSTVGIRIKRAKKKLKPLCKKINHNL